MNVLSVSLILPVFNEEGAIGNVVRSAVEALSGIGESFEIIVVDDGSTDASSAVVRRLMAEPWKIRLLRHSSNRGVGAALATGIAASCGRILCYMDADGQFESGDLLRCLPLIQKYQMVMGRRVRRADSRVRLFNSRLWNALVSLLFGIRVQDVDCGLKLLLRSPVFPPRIRAATAVANVELLWAAKQAGLSVAEVPVLHRNREAGRASGHRPKVIVQALFELFLMRLLWTNRQRTAHTS